MYILGKIIIILLAAVGITDLIKSVIVFFTKYNYHGEVKLVIPFKGHCEDAEILLRSAVVRTKWLGKGFIKSITCLDCGMDSDTEEICKALKKEYPFIDIEKSYKK